MKPAERNETAAEAALAVRRAADDGVDVAWVPALTGSENP